MGRNNNIGLKKMNENKSLLKKVFQKIKILTKQLMEKLKKKTPIYIPVLHGNLLQNRTALITGGTSGIGYAIAESFLQNGANVIISGRNIDRVNKAVLELENKDVNFKGKIYGIILDVTDVNQFENIVGNALQITGKEIDILVNNAGIGIGTFGSITEDEYDTVMETNLKGAFFLSQLIANYMRKKNIKGNILNVASSSSLRPAITPYALSKWGLRGFTLGLAKMLIPYGIVVNAIAPGPTATPMLTNDINDISLNENPSNRFSTTTEIANLATILVSDLGKMIVGDVLYATGGAGLITYDDNKYIF